MNDRFKFRVWDTFKNKYSVEDWLPMIDEQGDLCFRHTDDVYYPFTDQFIIEQCTGLKDKNGKLIYEGDIIHEVDKEAEIDDVSQIVWCQGTCHFMKLDLPDTGLDRHCILYEEDSPYIEIIGNIHKQTEQKD